MKAKIFFQLLKNHAQLRQGCLAFDEPFFESEFNKRIDLPTVKSVEVRFSKQRCLLIVIVGKAGLRYKYLCELRLQSATLNNAPKRLIFRQLRQRVKPDNLAAKAVEFAPVLIPEISGILSVILRQIFKGIASHYVSGVVDDAMQTTVTREGEHWHVAIPTEQLPATLQEPIKIPLLEPRRLLGEVIRVRRVAMVDRQFQLDLVLHPEVRELLDSKFNALTGWPESLQFFSVGDEEKSPSAEEQGPTAASLPGVGGFGGAMLDKLKKSRVAEIGDEVIANGKGAMAMNRLIKLKEEILAHEPAGHEAVGAVDAVEVADVVDGADFGADLFDAAEGWMAVADLL